MKSNSQYNHELRSIENAYICILIVQCMRITFQKPEDVSGWGKRLHEIIKYLSLQTLCQALVDFTFPTLKEFFQTGILSTIMHILFQISFFQGSLKVFFQHNEHYAFVAWQDFEFLSVSKVLKIDFLHPTRCSSTPVPVIAGLLSSRITQCSCHWSKVNFDPCTNLIAHCGRVAAISAQILRDC